MHNETRYPFLSEGNLELIRHCSLPFFLYSVSNPASKVDFGFVINSVSIIPSRHYVLHDFTILLAQFDANIPSPVSTPIMPLLNIQGAKYDENIDAILSQWSSPAYTYNGVANNPNKTINKQDVTASVLSTSNNYNFLEFSNISYPLNYSNIITQKTICNISGNIESLPGFVTAGVVGRNIFADFYFRNTNYSSILFYPTPMIANSGSEINSMYGIINFDLKQYSMKN